MERPERLIAAKIGLAAAVTRIQEVVGKSAGDPNDLVAALDKLTLGSRSSDITAPMNVVHSSATLDILNHPAVKFTHGFPDPNTAKDSNEYLRNLKKWSEDSIEKISKGDSEIPQGLAQGDLYRAPQSYSYFHLIYALNSLSRIFERNPRCLRHRVRMHRYCS